MQFSGIALNVSYAVVGVVLMFLSYRVIDRRTPEGDFPAELQKGNVAVASSIDRWRYAETLEYVRKIRANKDWLTP
ncbi:MAG: DUF350 domain-containing protein [bacterium]